MVGVGGMPTNSQTLPTPWLGWLARCGWLDASHSHLRELLDRSRALVRDLSNKSAARRPATLASCSVLARSASAARRRPLAPAVRCWLARCRPLGVGHSRRLFGVGSLGAGRSALAALAGCSVLACSVRVVLSVGGDRRECIGRPPCQGRFASRLRRDQVASRPDPLTWSLSAANEQAPWAGSACPPLAPAIPTGLVRHPCTSLARHCLGRRSLPARHPASLARHCVVRHPASCAGPLG